MTVRELIEMLELFDGDLEVMYSEDTIRCRELHGVDSVRKIRKDIDGKIKEVAFVAIN